MPGTLRVPSLWDGSEPVAQAPGTRSVPGTLRPHASAFDEILGRHPRRQKPENQRECVLRRPGEAERPGGGVELREGHRAAHQEVEEAQ